MIRLISLIHNHLCNKFINSTGSLQLALPPVGESQPVGCFKQFT